MSHAGRRIASTAAAAAAVALPVAAAGSAYADSLPLVGQLPAVGNLADSATSSTGGLTQGLPISNLPVVGGLTSQATGGSPLSGLPLVGTLTSGGLPNVAGLAGNGTSSPLNGLSAVSGLTSSLTKGGLPLVGSVPGLGNLAGLGSAAAQGRMLTLPTVPESLPMQPAQKEATAVLAQAPAAAEHAIPVPQHATTTDALRHVTTDAQKLTTHYVAKHAAKSKAAHSEKG
jgi:hypothetical protein